MHYMQATDYSFVLSNQLGPINQIINDRKKNIWEFDSLLLPMLVSLT